MHSPTQVSRARMFDGVQSVYELSSASLNGTTRVAVYTPPAASDKPSGVLYYLSGLTCTDQNVVTKAGAQRLCAELGLIFVCPDTSPRGADVPDAPDDDLGQGASFYVNATEAPWSRHFQMESFIIKELVPTIDAMLGTTEKRGIMGHSMGGHGALTLALKHPGVFHSVSAISPIANPSNSPWGRKTLAAYLGPDEATWEAHDATCLLLAGKRPPGPILVDQGGADPFLETHLMPSRLRGAATKAGVELIYNERPGYDHSYYFVATAIDDHIRHHAQFVG